MYEYDDHLGTILVPLFFSTDSLGHRPSLYGPLKAEFQRQCLELKATRLEEANGEWRDGWTKADGNQKGTHGA